jgi:hypothetical protein
MQPLYISYLGWNAPFYGAGQFEIDNESLEKAVTKVNQWRKERNEELSTSLVYNEVDGTYFIKQINERNYSSLIPVVNVFNGVRWILASLFYSDANLLVTKEHRIPCRLLLFTVGILEITWIGGVIIHGLASLYFCIRHPNLVID